MNDESVRWVEENARAVSAFQERVIDALERQASAFLNVLLAGAGGSLAYAVNLVEKQAAAWQQAGMAGVSLWLFAIAALVLWRAMWSRPVWPPANDPGNLTSAYEMDLTSARVRQLKNQQAAITANRERNEEVGRWLNCCRLLVAATPVIFAAASGLTAWAG